MHLLTADARLSGDGRDAAHELVESHAICALPRVGQSRGDDSELRARVCATLLRTGTCKCDRVSKAHDRLQNAPVQCSLPLDIQPEQQIWVKGINDKLLGMVMQTTQVRINPPAALHAQHGATAFLISGPLENIMLARRMLIVSIRPVALTIFTLAQAMLPATFSFNLPPGIEPPDREALRENYGVREPQIRARPGSVESHFVSRLPVSLVHSFSVAVRRGEVV